PRQPENFGGWNAAVAKAVEESESRAIDEISPGRDHVAPRCDLPRKCRQIRFISARAMKRDKRKHHLTSERSRGHEFHRLSTASMTGLGSSRHSGSEMSAISVSSLEPVSLVTAPILPWARASKASTCSFATG